MHEYWSIALNETDKFNLILNTKSLNFDTPFDFKKCIFLSKYLVAGKAFFCYGEEEKTDR